MGLVLRHLLFFLVLGVFVSSEARGESPRTAVVDVQELFREYHKSVSAQEEINIERARIQKENNKVKQRLREMDRAIRVLRQRFADPAKVETRSKDEVKEMQRELALRTQEWEALERARRKQVEQQNKELNQKMTVRMASILEEIRDYVEETGRKAGFDYVFDIAGLNTSHVPSVLYSKDATDITPIILKELNKNAPQRH